MYAENWSPHHHRLSMNILELFHWFMVSIDGEDKYVSILVLIRPYDFTVVQPYHFAMDPPPESQRYSSILCLLENDKNCSYALGLCQSHCL